MRSVGLDLGVRKIAFCEVKDGVVVERRTVRSLGQLIDVLGPNTPEAVVAFEACRQGWHVHDTLKKWGHQPKMIDTTKARRIGVGEHRRKTDRIDAEKIARAVEGGTIPAAHVLAPARRHLREHLGVRRALVEARAQFVTTVRGIAYSCGIRLPSCKTSSFVSKLEETELDPVTRSIVAPLEKALSTMEQELERVERKLDELYELEPVIQLLATAPGVGRVVAATFVSVIDEASRFRGGHQVGAYLGLVPSEDSSGDRRRLGGITKQGNPYARAMLVEAAWCILRLREDDPLKLWAKAVEQRRGTRIAVVALARRLAGVLWAMWRDGTVYEPGRLGAKMALGLERQAQKTDVRAAALRRAAKKVARRRAKTAAAPEETRKS